MYFIIYLRYQIPTFLLNQLCVELIDDAY